MWQVTKAKPCSLGFVMAVHAEPSLGNLVNALHINVLEFVALTVNVWFVLACCHHDDPVHTYQHVGNFLADNTFTISWMLHVRRAPMPHACHLASFLQALLTFSPVLLQFQSNHISGHSNDTADLLSQTSHAESWASIMSLRPMDLHSCTPFLMLHELLFALLGCITGTRTKAISAGRTIAQSIPELLALPPGWDEWDMTISLSG